MPANRRPRGEPSFVDTMGLMGVAPQVSNATARQMIPTSSPKQEYAESRDWQAALEANPEAAARLARNQLLWIVVPVIVIAAFLLFMYFVR